MKRREFLQVTGAGTLGLAFTASILSKPKKLEANMADPIVVSLTKPKDVVKKTDNLKVQGNIDGLEAGKTYIIRVQVFEDGATNYSAPLLQSFTVEA